MRTGGLLLLLLLIGVAGSAEAVRLPTGDDISQSLEIANARANITAALAVECNCSTAIEGLEANITFLGRTESHRFDIGRMNKTTLKRENRREFADVFIWPEDTEEGNMTVIVSWGRARLAEDAFPLERPSRLTAMDMSAGGAWRRVAGWLSGLWGDVNVLLLLGILFISTVANLGNILEHSNPAKQGGGLYPMFVEIVRSPFVLMGHIVVFVQRHRLLAGAAGLLAVAYIL